MIFLLQAIVPSQTLHKKQSFPLRISSVHVTKSAGNCGFGHIYWRNPSQQTFVGLEDVCKTSSTRLQRVFSVTILRLPRRLEDILQCSGNLNIFNYQTLLVGPWSTQKTISWPVKLLNSLQKFLHYNPCLSDWRCWVMLPVWTADTIAGIADISFKKITIICDLVPLILKTAVNNSLFSFIFVTCFKALLEGLCPSSKRLLRRSEWIGSSFISNIFYSSLNKSIKSFFM